MAKHQITTQFTPHGSFSWEHTGNDLQWAAAGTLVKLHWANDTDWGLQEAHYTTAGGSVVPIDITVAVPSFTMPDADIVISGTFKRFVLPHWTEGKNPSVGSALVVDENGSPVPEALEDLAATLINTESMTEALDGKVDAPAEAGESGQVLQLDAEGNPQWVTPSAGTVPDAEMSDDSTNAVQNKVIKKYVDDETAKKANVDGSYETLYAGSAGSIRGTKTNTDTYLERPTGGEGNEVANGLASVVALKGNSTNLNQKVQLPSNSFSKLNVAISNNKVTHTSTGEGLYSYQVYYAQSNSLNIIYGHKYYMSAYLEIDYNGGTPVGIGIAFGSGTVSGGRIATRNTTQSGIVKNIGSPSQTPEDDRGIYFNWTNANRTSIVSGATFTASNIMCIDVTLIFGAGNEPSTAEEFEVWLAHNVGMMNYYPYNAGSIVNSVMTGFKTTGRNLLDPVTKKARCLYYTWEDHNGMFTVKGLPSGATLTFTPDATGVAEAVTPDADGHFSITGDGWLEASAATAETYVCMTWDETKDEEVVPYESHDYPFDVRKVYGQLDGEGELVQVFPSGMRKVSSVADLLTAGKAVVNIGVQSVTGAISDEVTLDGCDTSVTDYLCALGNVGTLAAGVLTLTAPVTAENVLYKLDTPLTYTNLVYRDNGVDTPLGDVLIKMLVDNWGIEQVEVTPYSDGIPTSCAPTIETLYGIDVVEQLDTLDKDGIDVAALRANLNALVACINTNCGEVLGGTISVSETATDKVFAFTFTPNPEPEPTNNEQEEQQ